MYNKSMKSCFTCKHFYSTWDQSAPRGCKAYGVKSTKMPIQIIQASTVEKKCLGYEEKITNKKRYENRYGD